MRLLDGVAVIGDAMHLFGEGSDFECRDDFEVFDHDGFVERLDGFDFDRDFVGDRVQDVVLRE